jgi:hypothetical protein
MYPENSQSNSSEVKTDNFINKMKNENEKNENENENLIYISNEINMKILNLMTFEDLHDWLAPTGHIYKYVYTCIYLYMYIQVYVCHKHVKIYKCICK